MKIDVSGHHVEITESIKQDLSEKFAKIEKHYPTLISIKVIISKQHNEFYVELSTMYEGQTLASKDHDEVMYPAIAKTIKKLDAALAHRKGMLKANLRKDHVGSSPDIAHERIQELNLN
jgi:ribosomal subunit interface protein